MRQWKILCQDEKKVADLCGTLGCSRFFACILINRGITTSDEARTFLDIDSRVLADPFMFRDMDTAVERIGQAIK